MTMPIMLLHKEKKQQSPLKRTGIEMPSLLQCNKKHESEWLQANFLAQTETWVLSSEKRKKKKQSLKFERGLYIQLLAKSGESSFSFSF